MQSKEKAFKLSAEQIAPIVLDRGSCVASDHITVDGRKVGFMYRRAPNDDIDSGWRFLSGLESSEFVDKPENFAIYDINTIANYDVEIVPLLDAPLGSAFERKKSGGPLVEVFDFKPD